MTALTRTQRKRRSEVEQIASTVDMDVWNIERQDLPFRDVALRAMKDKLVRSEVIYKYTLIDEFLTDMICDYYFQRRKKSGVSYKKLWKTKNFRIFVHYLMDETFLLKKLAVVEAIEKVPTDVSNAIKRINDARNALAHSFFPENRRRYMSDKKVTYKVSHLFTLEGVEKFKDDCVIAEEWLVKKIFW